MMKCENWEDIDSEAEGCDATHSSRENPKVWYFCTRREDHDGPHHAHGRERCLLTWSDAEVGKP